MPWGADGKWIPEDDSVSKKLTGLLGSDSEYIQQAEQLGTRQAHKRGLLNSSLAAGAARASAIAAAAPIASQEASAITGRNQAVLEGGITKENSLTLQSAQDKAAMERQLEGQKSQASLQDDDQETRLQIAKLDTDSAMLRQKEAQGFELTKQEKDNLAAMERQKESLASSERQSLLQSQSQLATQKLASQSDLTGQYLNALGNLTSNTKMKAADRERYIAEFQRVTQQGQAYLKDTLPNIPIDWGGGTPAA